MSAPFIFVTTHKLNEGVLDEFLMRDQHRARTKVRA